MDPNLISSIDYDDSWESAFIIKDYIIESDDEIDEEIFAMNTELNNN